MKFPSVSIVEILSPAASPRTPAPGGGGGRRRRRAGAGGHSAPPSPPPSADLTAVSRPDGARQLRRCICPEILRSCLCRELTRTRDGVCDLCLYGIHVEERGELFGDGYRGSVPAPLRITKSTSPSTTTGPPRRRRSADARARLSAVLERDEGALRRLSEQSSRLSRAREDAVPPVGVVVAGRGTPADFDEHNMI